jgi:hypothetical protein
MNLEENWLIDKIGSKAKGRPTLAIGIQYSGLRSNAVGIL